MDGTSKLNLPKIHIVGLWGGWRQGLSPAAETAVLMADLLVGGKRQLSFFPEFEGEQLAIGTNIGEVVNRLQAAREAGQKAVVLASGDPLCFGIGGTLRRFFAAEALKIHPMVSAFQLAFAAVGEPWQDAQLVSGHGRAGRPVLQTVLTHRKTAVLTDRQNSPDTLAADLLKLPIAPDSRCVVCEQLGSEDEQVFDLTLAEVAKRPFHPLNVMLVWNDAPIQPRPVGLPDDAFATERKQVTKREVRQVVLSELSLRPYETMWDIGAGSGSVAIEAARAQPTAQVLAFEKDGTMAAHCRQNIATHGAFNVTLYEGAIPALAEADLPDPDVVFVGGSGGFLAEILALAKVRLRLNGRLVATFATLENLAIAQAHLPAADSYQIQINRIKPIAKNNRLSALNPVFVVRWMKREAL
ncbi:MAG: precorrin-6y C5,15-methyltransferase (decarboxylating) subunit CbiE [Chloroflexota bacterium]